MSVVRKARHQAKQGTVEARAAWRIYICSVATTACTKQLPGLTAAQLLAPVDW